MKRSVLAVALTSLLLASCGPNNKSPISTSNRPEAIAQSQTAQPKPCINLNTATASELMTLPGIGEVMARRVIEYREQSGPFRRAQDIIIIDGFSERKYRDIAQLICV